MNKIQEFEMWLSDMDTQLHEANKAGVPLIVKDMKYTQGYIPKIKYWYGVLTQAEGATAMNKALNKMNYFQNRHYEVYGKWVSVDELI
jgi:hypothetical protein